MFMFEYSYTSVTEVFCSDTCGESHPFTGTNFLFEYLPSPYFPVQALVKMYRPTTR